MSPPHCTSYTFFTIKNFLSFTDIIECPGACKDEKAVCTNIPGSYHCGCMAGYTGTGSNKSSCKGEFHRSV